MQLGWAALPRIFGAADHADASGFTRAHTERRSIAVLLIPSGRSLACTQLLVLQRAVAAEIREEAQRMPTAKISMPYTPAYRDTTWRPIMIDALDAKPGRVDVRRERERLVRSLVSA